MQNLKVSLKIILIPIVSVLIVGSVGFGLIQHTEEAAAKPLKNKMEVDTVELQYYRLKQQELLYSVKSYFEDAIASGDIVGAGVSIVFGDSIVISEGFGKKSTRNGDSVDKETVFRLGSLSKGFAGVLMASLNNDGLLDWNDRIYDCIPNFQLGDTGNTKKITLANILSHSSGAPYHSFTNLVEAGIPLEDIAVRFKEVTPVSKPGVIYSYQNAMFAFCEEVIRQKAGQDFKSIITKRLFKPLGMSSITMDHETLVNSQNLAIPHRNRGNGWEPLKLKNSYYNAISAGGINASAEDMAKWIRFLLGHNPEVMERLVVQQAFTPFIEIKGNGKYYQRWSGHLKSYYGFGWRIHEYEDKRTQEIKTMVHHGGSVNDFRNEIALFLEEDFGICVLLNNRSRIAERVIPDLYEIIQNVFYLRGAAQRICPDNS